LKSIIIIKLFVADTRNQSHRLRELTVTFLFCYTIKRTLPPQFEL